MPVSTPSTALFTSGELGNWLSTVVSDDRGAIVEQVVWGWLKVKSVLDLAERPDPVPDEVFSWAIELGAIAHENPSGLSSKELGPGKQQFSAERRAEILAEAAGGTTLQPQGSFPAAPSYPDPAVW